MVGAKLLGQMGQLGSFAAKGGPAGGTGTSAFALGGFGKDGSGTERSAFAGNSGVDKSF
jgi:hypothetical protein